MKKYPCAAKGCIAVVEAEGDLCAAHYDLCSLCGHPKRMHPVVLLSEEFGAITKCYEFQRQGMVERTEEPKPLAPKELR